MTLRTHFDWECTRHAIQSDESRICCGEKDLGKFRRRILRLEFKTMQGSFQSGSPRNQRPVETACDWIHLLKTRETVCPLFTSRVHSRSILSPHEWTCETKSWSNIMRNYRHWQKLLSILNKVISILCMPPFCINRGMIIGVWLTVANMKSDRTECVSTKNAQ